MATVTFYCHVQWSQVWGLPVWLWLEYVAGCEAALKKAKEGTEQWPT